VRSCIAFTILLLSLACLERPAASRSKGRRDSAVALAEARQALGSDEGRCGYVDKTGQLAIGRRFDRAGEFAAGLAAVSSNRKTGFIDTRGEYAIAPAFDEAKPFHDGLAAVCVDGKGWGYIDAKGAWAIAPSFGYADAFVDGVAVVKAGGDVPAVCADAFAREIPAGSECESDMAADPDEDGAGQFFLVDRSGRRLHEKGYRCITRMSEGLAAARGKKTWGYLNRAGQEAIAPRFVRAKPFGEGRAAVFLTDRALPGPGADGEGKWGFIDRRGRFVTQVKYRATEVGVFSQGLVAMEGLPVKTLLASPIGRACVRPDDPSDPRSSNRDDPVDCGVFLDKKGGIRIAVPYCAFDDSPPGFRSFREFSAGLAEVVTQEPIRIKPFECAPALMRLASAFVDLHGNFQPAANALMGRSPEGLVPKCKGEEANKEVRPFVWK
jgi:hypothetical protein